MTSAVLTRRQPTQHGTARRYGQRRHGRRAEATGEGYRLAAMAEQARLAQRVERIISQPFEYHVCRAFKRLHLERPILPAHAQAVNERTLLSAEQETDLFVRLNYCKFRADILRRQLPRAAATGEAAADELLAAAPLLAEIESCLAIATQLRDCLVRAFLKLAISLLGPFVSRRHGFEELLSEGAMALLRAAEKFDPDRGFRFSTYATPAVRRRLERFVTGACKDQQILVRTAHLDTVPAARCRTSAEDRQHASAIHALDEMVARLDAREQSILRARFGLEPGCDPQSLQEVAGQIGVCRERVRQIEARALEKLREMPEAAAILRG